MNFKKIKDIVATQQMGGFFPARSYCFYLCNVWDMGGMVLSEKMMTYLRFQFKES